MTKFFPLTLVFSLLLLAGLVGCSSSGDEAQNGAITVFAAASLKKTFTELGEQFKTDTPDTFVQFNFAGSSDLVTQLARGASADVFASADTNTPTIVTAPRNPKQVASFADLNKAGLTVVVCAPELPCGSATKKVENASVTDVLNEVTSR